MRRDLRIWNKSDHADRIKDGSITYDSFTMEKDKIEYHICKCMYVEMFHGFGFGSVYKSIRSHLEGSLDRLQTDYVDIYYLHSVFCKPISFAE